MTISTNKHVLVAMLVAPMLAVIAWFAVDALIGERSQPAKAGAAYRLIAAPNCRYASGVCDLRNEDMQLQLSRGTPADTLLLDSQHPMDGVTVSFSAGGLEYSTPVAMDALFEDRYSSPMMLPDSSLENARLRLAATAAGSTYFCELSLRFMMTAE